MRTKAEWLLVENGMVNYFIHSSNFKKKRNIKGKRYNYFVEFFFLEINS
jgi:hypothetical protein